MKHIVVFLGVGFFLTAGLGFNIEKYCCNICAAKGSDYIINHEYNFSIIAYTPSCAATAIEESCCNIKRYQVDIPIRSSVSQHVEFKPYMSDYVITKKHNYADHLFLEEIPFYKPPNNTGIKTGRDILVKKSVLRI